jgi:general secretion pathway protein K
VSNKGYALPTILIIAMIIIVITMSIISSGREKIAVAFELKEKGKAYLLSYSAMNEVIYTILTSSFTRTGLRIYKVDGSELEWNLYGDPIKLGESVSVKLRDEAGMFSPLFNPTSLGRLVEYLSDDPGKSMLFSDTLADWQDRDDFRRLNGAERIDYKIEDYAYGPRNFYIQLPEEIMLLKGFDSALFDDIEDEIFYWGTNTRNYLTMSRKSLMAQLRDDSLVDEIIELRKKGSLTRRIFMDMTNLYYTEQSLFSPSGWIKVEVEARSKNATETIKACILKREMDESPYLISEWRR